MKQLIPFIATCLLTTVLIGCWQETMPNTQQSPDYPHERIDPPCTDTILSGDLNADGATDSIFVTTSSTITAIDASGKPVYTFGCPRDCTNRIRFSCNWPQIRLEHSVWATVVNAGDLNHDGLSELLVAPGWFIGSQENACLYTLRNRKWERIARVTCRLEEEDRSAALQKLLVRRNSCWYLQELQVDSDDSVCLIPIHF